MTEQNLTTDTDDTADTADDAEGHMRCGPMRTTTTPRATYAPGPMRTTTTPRATCAPGPMRTTTPRATCAPGPMRTTTTPRATPAAGGPDDHQRGEQTPPSAPRAVSILVVYECLPLCFRATMAYAESRARLNGARC